MRYFIHKNQFVGGLIQHCKADHSHFNQPKSSNLHGY